MSCYHGGNHVREPMNELERYFFSIPRNLPVVTEDMKFSWEIKSLYLAHFIIVPMHMET